MGSQGNKSQGSFQEHQRDSPGHQEDASEQSQDLLEECHCPEGDHSLQKIYGWCRQTFQCKVHKATQGRWPLKSCEFLLDMLKNAESNAEYKGLEADHLVVD